MAIKPIVLWSTPRGPNPLKVLYILEELAIPYEIKIIPFQDLKKPDFLKITPNGRVPAIEDPNTQITLWESGAIVQYLIEQYDSSHILSYTTLAERHLCNQWLQFQMSGQGPYFGQAGWFMNYHPEKLPSAVDRYIKEARRVFGVLEIALQGRQWLVGNKVTYADLVFVPWNVSSDRLLPDSKATMLDEFPAVKAWNSRMLAMPGVSKTMGEIREKLTAVPTEIPWLTETPKQ